MQLKPMVGSEKFQHGDLDSLRLAVKINDYSVLKSLNPDNVKTYCLISDTHIPYIDTKKLYTMVEKTKGYCDYLVIGGDIFNGDSLSSYDAMSNTLPLEEEIKKCIEIFNWLLKFYKKIYLVTGNHDRKRYLRTKFNKVPEHVRFLLKDPIEFIAEQFNGRVVIASNPIKGIKDHSESWYCKIGHDCLVTHAENYGKYTESINTAYKWFDEFEELTQIKMSEIKLFTQGHTHKLSLSFNKDTALIQTGCMISAQGQSYVLTGSCKGQLSQTGYTTFTQVDGITDLDSIKVVRLF